MLEREKEREREKKKEKGTLRKRLVLIDNRHFIVVQCDAQVE